MRRRAWCAAGAAIVAAALALDRAAIADVVAVPASKDTTLYESATGALGNGAGDYFTVGRTDVISGGAIRRAVIAFDVAAAVPAGATITRADLSLNMSRTIVGLQPVSLHRLLADWGEGASDAPGEEGGGTAAAPGDATWLHRFFDTTRWTTTGGDFTATPSTTVQIGAVGTYTFLSTAQMVADVQGWVDAPATNFGWLLRGNEATISTAKRFDSRSNMLLGALPPSLTIEFTVAAPGSGRVPDGGPAPGTPLTVAHAPGGAVRLAWGASCVAADTDFAIYAGAMTNFRAYAPKQCSTGGAAAATLTPAAGSEFYLVVPRAAAREGSYGTDSRGVERPPATPACVPQAIRACP